MSKIYVARHGQDEDNAAGILNGHRDTPLTDIGRGQARTLADVVRDANLNIRKIYSSPLQRAYATAETVASVLDVPSPEKLPLLIERDFGIMTGKPIGDIERLCAPDLIRSDTVLYFLSPPDAETFPELVDRAQKVFSFLSEQSSDGDVLLVTHGDTGKILYSVFYDLDWKDVLTHFHFGNCELLLLEKGSEPENRHIHQTQQYNH